MIKGTITYIQENNFTNNKGENISYAILTIVLENGMMGFFNTKHNFEVGEVVEFTVRTDNRGKFVLSLVR